MLNVVGNVQCLNLAEELVAFEVIYGELIEAFAESVQLEADTFPANPVGGGVVVHGISSVGSSHT
ncbi:MAG TPA: hypothetical protein VGE93_15235 [Bryobacteraceae bacterium]|nr:hypothetical protein [Acidobacteriaceae bacterium]